MGGVWEKLFFALLAGDPMILIDNLTTALQSNILAAVVTSAQYTGRILGLSKDVAVPTNASIIITGNNLSLRGDMPSRALKARIDAQCERPSARKFKYPDLEKFILENRVSLVKAALTIMQGYRAAGRPSQDLKSSRFHQWDEEIRSPLVWVGFADPGETRDSIDNEDPERERTIALLGAWRGHFGNQPVSIGHIIDAVQARKGAPPTSARVSDSELLRAMLDIASDKEDFERVHPHRLAQWCRSHKGRVVGGLRLVDAGEISHGGGKMWRVDVVDAAGTGADSDSDSEIV
jgi:hypothetical protein